MLLVVKDCHFSKALSVSYNRYVQILWNSKEIFLLIFQDQLYSRKNTPMEPQSQTTIENVYIPATSIGSATFRHSLSKVQVAIRKAPELICGFAQRVGYTGSQDKDLAIYRLKIKPGKDLPTVTLPGFFVIENGVFLEYEQWCQKREVNLEQ